MIAKKCLHIAFIPFPFIIFFIFFSFITKIAITIAIFLSTLQIFFIFFFRDVKREIEDDIISPADGKILYAKNNKISIFMGIFDMHVNLMPYDGKIVKMKYYEGAHKPAYKNVSKNERMEIEIESEIGKIKLIQIAGIFARRIVPYVKEEEYLKKGERIGIIRFGSRVEVILPKNCKIVVKEKEKIKAGKRIAIASQQI